MNLEHYFISQFLNKYNGDDGAYIDGYVYSKDAFFEDVHFKTSWMNYYEIAKKAMAVNISDAIAMNATPKYALLSVAMPKSMSKQQMQELARGFKETAQYFGIEIIGGDTLSNIKLDITVTIISKTEKPLYRSGIREGMFVAHTGVLGKSLQNLRTLMSGGSLHKRSKFLDIKLRSVFMKKSRRFLAAGMDISDGLGDDLAKIARYNSVGMKLFKKIPKRVMCSGEEYELLIAFDKRHLKALKRRSVQSRTPLHIVAKASRLKFTNRCKSHHF